MRILQCGRPCTQMSFCNMFKWFLVSLKRPDSIILVLSFSVHSIGFIIFHWVCEESSVHPRYFEFWLAAPSHFPIEFSQLSAMSFAQITMCSNSHAAEDTKACHLKKLKLQKSERQRRWSNRHAD